MKQGLIPGVKREVSFEVTEAMCPIFEGRVVHRVCATWTLVQYMELAGRLILMDYLEQHEEGVGSHVTCDHLSPAPVGAAVCVEATVRDVTDRALVCDVVATLDAHVVAMGRTEQKVFPREVLKRILKEP